MDNITDNLTDSTRGLLNRARMLCAGSEQCRSALQRKLTDWGATTDEAEIVIDRLVDEGFIDERRYARAYCESKLLRARWGERKVRYELMHKGIPQNIVDECILEIAPEERLEAIRIVADKKLATLHGMEPQESRRRLTAYLVQRGYTFDEINNLNIQIE